jgi:hypothetical protein
MVLIFNFRSEQLQMKAFVSLDVSKMTLLVLTAVWLLYLPRCLMLVIVTNRMLPEPASGTSRE